MIYEQTSIIINSKIDNVWNFVKKLMTTSDQPNIIPECNNIEILEEIDGKILRKLSYADRIEKEVVTVNFNNHRINITVQENTNYFIETLITLISPSEEFLSEKNTSLVIVSAARMHPGVFASPNFERQKFIEELAKNIKNEVEKENMHLV